VLPGPVPVDPPMLFWGEPKPPMPVLVLAAPKEEVPAPPKGDAVLLFAPKGEEAGAAPNPEVAGAAPNAEVPGAAPKAEVAGVAPKAEVAGAALKADVTGAAPKAD